MNEIQFDQIRKMAIKDILGPRREFFFNWYFCAFKRGILICGNTNLLPVKNYSKFAKVTFTSFRKMVIKFREASRMTANSQQLVANKWRNN